MHIWTRLKSNDFLRHNGVLFVGSMFVAVLNYLFYPVLGRLLPTAQFGEVQALVSLFIQINIFLAVVTNVAVNVVANEQDAGKRDRTVIELERLALLITGTVALISLIFLGQVRTFLRFDDNSPFVILALALVMSAPLALQTAFMRGRAAFGQLSINSILGALVKLLASVAFVLIGFGTAGAIGGLVAGQICALVLAHYQTRKLGFRRPAGLRPQLPNFAIIRPQLRYSILVLIVSLVTTYLFSVDVVVMKHYFDAQTAGLYAGIATIGRIIFFFTGSIATVLLTSVKLDAKPKDNQRLLVRSIMLHTALGGFALVVFSLLPELVTHLLIGAKYVPMAGLLPRLSLALFIIALANLFFSYDLALRRWSAAVVATLGAIITFTLIATSHATPANIINDILLGGLAIIILRLLDSARRAFYARFPHNT